MGVLVEKAINWGDMAKNVLELKKHTISYTENIYTVLSRVKFFFKISHLGKILENQNHPPQKKM